MRKEKEIDFYAEARRRSLLASQSAVDAIFGVSATINKAELGKASSRARSKKYARTEKGKKTNNRKCKKYQRAHRSKVYGYVKKYRENFEKLYGMKYGTYLYRKKHGLPVPTIKKKNEEKNPLH